ncbi:MAG TPA: ARMT1-like domain-containing protein [Candidatus Acidoferrales bacterium]|nr:ARMT1-like domain-containing protein [Candidatus Acidoferrales bacterium]
MNVFPECIPCLVSRVLYEAKLSSNDVAAQLKAEEAAVAAMCRMGFTGPIALLSTEVHRAVYRELGDDDPYRRVKIVANETALKFLPAVRSIIQTSSDPFRSAVIAAIIGNTFDFGVLGFEVALEDFEEEVASIYRHGLDIDDTEAMKHLVKDVVYVADNVGEIVYDGLLIEQLQKLGGRVTLVVRGGHVLTDATIDDVLESGLDEVADKVITTGSNAIGIKIDEVSAELRGLLSGASLIVAKGMANYEMLSEYSFRPVAYLMRVKCAPVAASVGAHVGDFIAKLVR